MATEVQERGARRIVAEHCESVYYAVTPQLRTFTGLTSCADGSKRIIAHDYSRNGRLEMLKLFGPSATVAGMRPSSSATRTFSCASK
jgi:hypothetical protein